MSRSRGLPLKRKLSRVCHSHPGYSERNILGNCTRSTHAVKAWIRKLLKSGAPGEIRTPDLLLRRQSLYPSELRARWFSLHAAAGAINRALIWQGQDSSEARDLRL